jgi:putative membrane protein
LIALVIRWLLGSSRGGSVSPSVKSPLDILKKRFARGEIEKEEFEERRRMLGT